MQGRISNLQTRATAFATDTTITCPPMFAGSLQHVPSGRRTCQKDRPPPNQGNQHARHQPQACSINRHQHHFCSSRRFNHPQMDPQGHRDPPRYPLPAAPAVPRPERRRQSRPGPAGSGGSRRSIPHTAWRLLSLSAACSRAAGGAAVAAARSPAHGRALPGAPPRWETTPCTHLRRQRQQHLQQGLR